MTGTTLRGITWEHSRGYDCQVAASAEYATLTGIRVEWEFRSLQAFADAPLDELATAYDLLVIDHPHIPLAVEQGCLLSLDGRGHDDELRSLEAHSVGHSHASYAYAGHQWGLATDAAAQVSVYRPDLCPDPPTTWPEVLDLARAGQVLWAAKPIDAFSSLLTLVAGAGHPAGECGALFLDPNAAADALDLMRELATLVPEWCLEANPIRVAEALSTGDKWTYAPLSFGYVSYSRPGFRPHRLRHGNIPESTRGVAGSLLGGAGVAVSSRTGHPRESVDHAFWLARPEVQAGTYYDHGGQPGHSLAWDDERLDVDSWGFFRGTRATLEGAAVRPRHPGFVALQDLASPWVTEALRGRTDGGLVARVNAAAAELMVLSKAGTEGEERAC